MINLNNNHPYNMNKVTRFKSTKSTKRGKKARERVRLEAKRHSPGVPPNTCPYIDLVITMISDMQNSYERYRTKGEHNPVMDNIATAATDMMEYIRTNNETLRDNSAYWYNKYKQQLK